MRKYFNMSSRVVFSTFFGNFMSLFYVFILKILKTEAKEVLSNRYLFYQNSSIYAKKLKALKVSKVSVSLNPSQCQ